MEFSRPEYWSGLPFPSPGDIPNPGIKTRSPALQADSLPAELSVYQGVGKESTCNARDLGLIPGLGSSPGEGNIYPLQYSGQENFMVYIVYFEIASKYCISDSSVDFDGYSISSKGFLPTVADIMVI